jgi:hypothetical protein
MICSISCSPKRTSHERQDGFCRHIGTVPSRLAANMLFIEPFHLKYGLEITSLSDEEILKNAGLRSFMDFDLIRILYQYSSLNRSYS